MALELKIGKGKTQVQIEAHQYSDGISIILYGGDKPHIGAVALSIPRQSLRDKKKTSCSTSILTITRHKDDEIAKDMAEAISKDTKKTVVVIAGVHIEKATGNDIEKVKKNCRKASKKLIELFNN